MHHHVDQTLLSNGANGIDIYGQHPIKSVSGTAGIAMEPFVKQGKTTTSTTTRNDNTSINHYSKIVNRVRKIFFLLLFLSLIALMIFIVIVVNRVMLDARLLELANSTNLNVTNG